METAINETLKTTLVAPWLYRYPKFKEIVFDISDPSTYPFAIGDHAIMERIKDLIPYLLGHIDCMGLTPLEVFFEKERIRSIILSNIEFYIEKVERRRQLRKNYEQQVGVKRFDSITPYFRSKMYEAVTSVVKHGSTYAQAARDFRVDCRDLRVWCDLYSHYGKNFINYKVEYTDEQKMQIVKEYLTTDQSIHYMCVKYFILKYTRMRDMVSKYKKLHPYLIFNMPPKGGPEFYNPMTYGDIDPRDIMIQLPPPEGMEEIFAPRHAANP